MKVVVGITGASGVIYGVRLLEVLQEETFLIISENGKKLIKEETDHLIEDLKSRTHYYEDYQLDAPLASGSFFFDAMVIAPCSVSTLSKIASGIADTLITRCAAVALKEGRKLILVPRETPLSTIHLQNMTFLSTLGVVILPPVPAFYCMPQSIDDAVDFVVGKILDQLKISHDLFRRWGTEPLP
jgi:4-hydroxy-3-polyprenylbenzoate decarboxylase